VVVLHHWVLASVWVLYAVCGLYTSPALVEQWHSM